MTYHHLGIEVREQAKQITQNGTGKRLYQTPAGKIYPSITTVLAHLKEEILINWRKRVGNKEADFESQWGRDRGDLLHSALEKILKNESIVGYPILIRMLVEDLIPYLRNINNIHVQEQPLFSDLFQIAGRCDTIGEYKGKLSVIDFKGSKKPKRKEWIEDYFMQTSFYSYAYFERTGIKINQCVILIATETGHPQEFIEKPWDWWEPLKKVRSEYRLREGM